MLVKILDYGEENNKKFIEYGVFGLTSAQMEFLGENLEEQTSIEEDAFKLKMFFSEELYPFQSDVAQYRLDDFIAREEIEMAIFISSFLDDM